MTDQTVRDQFAMAALTRLARFPAPGLTKATTRDVAVIAYAYADAMMEARALSPRKGGDKS